MINDLKIYLRNELLITEEFGKLFEADAESYPSSRVESNNTSIEYYKFKANIQTQSIKTAQNGVDCEIIKKMEELNYTISFNRVTEIFDMPSWEIVFSLDEYGIGASVNGGGGHFLRVMQTVMEAAKEVAKKHKVRFFQFYGVSDPVTTCVGNKITNREKDKKEKLEAMGRKYTPRTASKRSVTYARSANSKNLGSTLIIGNYVVVDMGVIMPELFDESKYDECAMFTVEMQRASLALATNVANNTRCRNGKISDFRHSFPHKNIRYMIIMGDGLKIKLKNSNSGELIDEYLASDVKDAVEKIGEYKHNPIIEVDVKELIGKLHNKLLAHEFVMISNTDTTEGDKVVIYKYELDEYNFLRLKISETEQKIDVYIEEVFDMGGEDVTSKNKISSVNIDKIVKFINEFSKDIKTPYIEEKFQLMSQDEQLNFLLHHSNIKLEYRFLVGKFGRPDGESYDEHHGYVMRYVTELDGIRIFEDFVNDIHDYQYVITINDAERNQLFHKVFDGGTIKEILQHREGNRDTLISKFN